ncbi:acyltransferase family protein [Asticcacaulis machinosus]|uniref:Acyltransferase n=1 Tax=Asticcacaulis machinosus TaxID=2984211 RepID=A0ABT5HKK3_9CAUL|nr:acyltransferase [Asticcacaulis machinosus]MDC7676523.1 acyltransferase [Asticcacaulis machinosus]
MASVASAAPKPAHLNTLDGLRGIAAVSVMAFHWHIEAGSSLFQHSRLAVDLFFLMSGFVLAYAYDARLKAGLSFWAFFIARLIRLYPMILIGIGFGAGWFALDWLITGEQTFSAPQFVTYLFMNLFMIPVVTWDQDMAMFPLNLVLWSLFFELVAYAAYGLVFARAKTRWLVPVIVVGAIGVTGWVVFNFGAAPTPPAGLGFLKQGFVADLSRISLSFFLGVMIFRGLPRLNAVPPIPAVFLPLICLLIFVQPAGILPWWACLFIVLIVFPYMLSSAIRENITGRYGAISKFLGDISYPLYVTHLPIMWAMRAVLHKLFPNLPIVWLGIIVLPGCVLVAYLMLRFYDQPVRHYLRHKFLSSGLMVRDKHNRLQKSQVGFDGN